MAVMTRSGRAALAQAVKGGTLHLAWGRGDPEWETGRTHTGTFGAGEDFNLPHAHVAGVTVWPADPERDPQDPGYAAPFAAGTDYTVDLSTGKVRRVVTGSIPAGTAVTVDYTVKTPPEPVAQTALLDEVGRRVVDEVEYVAPHEEGGIVVPTGRFTLSAEPTNHLLIRVRFDFADAATETIREQGLFFGCTTAAGLPAGQKYFTPGEVDRAGILLVLQNSVPIVRQPSTRETFEFVVTL